MRKCPYCGEEVQDMDVLFHKCAPSTENGKPNDNGFKRWLIITTIISGIIWLASLRICIVLGIGLVHFWGRLIYSLFLIPIILLFSWILWGREKKTWAIVISFFVSLASFIVWGSIYFQMLFA